MTGQNNTSDDAKQQQTQQKRQRFAITPHATPKEQEPRPSIDEQKQKEQQERQQQEHEQQEQQQKKQEEQEALKQQEELQEKEQQELESVAQETEHIRQDVLDSEVAQAGVQTTDDTAQLPPEVEKAGVEDVSENSDQTQQQLDELVQLPITDEQIAKGLHAPFLSSFHWLAEWCVKQLKKAHVTVKEVGGTLLRVKV